MSHKTVFVKGADGEFHRFALLEITDRAAFVCREDVYEETRAGHREPPGIGFPLHDVYEVPTGKSDADLQPLKVITHA